MLETAIRRRWNINTEEAAKTINKHLGDADPRIALRAAGIAALMESQNQKDEHKELDEFSSRVLELAVRLGIDVSAIGASQATTAGAIAGVAGVNASSKE